MNFYKHHIGDYAAATEHLSWDEDQAYTRLLRVYYRDERPIPDNIKQACRLVRASSLSQRSAVESVLKEFFVLEEGVGWRNKRADAEISSAQARSEFNREVGKKGGRPPKSETRTDTDTEPVRVSDVNPNGSSLEPNRNPIQTPDSTSQKEEGSAHAPNPPPKSRKPKAAKSGFPDDFTLTPELAQYAIDRLPGVNPNELFEQFRGKALAKGWTYANWSQALQEFIRNVQPNSGHWAAGQYPKSAGAIQWQ